MQGSKHRQGDGETQIAQSYELVQAVGLREIGPGAPQRNEENKDASSAHRNYRAVDPKNCRDNSRLQVGVKRKHASSIWGTLLRSIRLQTIQRRVGEHAFYESGKPRKLD
jgi:hypothetical protein